jgi:hypothetical protein
MTEPDKFKEYKHDEDLALDVAEEICIQNGLRYKDHGCAGPQRWGIGVLLAEPEISALNPKSFANICSELKAFATSEGWRYKAYEQSRGYIIYLTPRNSKKKEEAK